MVLLNLLIKPVWLVVENQVQDQIGHAAFGTYASLLAFVTILGVATDLGINQFTTRHLARPEPQRQTYLPVLFSLKWVLSLLFPGLMVLAGWLLGYQGRELYWLLLVALGYSFSMFFAFFRAMLQGWQHFRVDAWASVSERVLQLLLLAGLMWVGLTLETFIYSRTVAVLLAFVGGLVVLRRYVGRIPFYFGPQRLRQVLQASFPFAMVMLVYGLNERIDMVMVERLHSKAEAGIYAAAYRWVDAVMMYLWSVLPVFFAQFAVSLASPERQKQLLRLGQVVTGVPIIFVGVFVCFYGQVFFWQFDHSAAWEIARMQLNLLVLFAQVVVQGFCALYSTLLTASNHERPVSRLVVAGVILNIMLNSLFVPGYGSLAAAATSLLCSAVVGAGCLVLTKTYLRLLPPWDLVLRMLLAGLLLAAVFKGLQYLSLTWYWTTAIAGGAYAGLLFLLRLVSWQELRHMGQKTSVEEET